MEIDFKWYDKYSTGVEEIDTQHKKFLNIMEKTFELKQKNIEEKELFKLLDELEKYAAYHFASEESLMKIYEYPKLSSQIQEHNKIKKDLQDKVEKIKKREEDLVDLMFFLMTWFINHTNRSDKDIGQFMKVYHETFCEF